jgi:hypothetical protein
VPIFRELWGWAAFVILAIASLILVVLTTPSGKIWQVLYEVLRKVEPLWVGSAILVYTVTEGSTLIGESFKRKMYTAGQDKALDAVEKALVRERNAEDARRIIKQAREIMRGDNLTPDLPTDA